MQGWRQRYGPVAALILAVWFVFQQIKDIILFRSDLTAMADTMAGWGPLQVPAPLLKWLLEFIVVFIIALLAAPAIDSWVRNLWSRWKDWRLGRKQRYAIRLLFPQTPEDDIILFSELLDGPRWYREGGEYARGSLATTFIRTIDQRFEGRHYATTKLLLREIVPKHKGLFEKLVSEWKESRRQERRARLRESIRGLGKGERTILWLFWRERGGMEVINNKHAWAASLDRKDIIRLESLWRDGTRVTRLAQLNEEAVDIVEEEVLGGKRVARLVIAENS